MFSSKSFTVPSLTFGSLIILNLSLPMVLGSFLIFHSSTCSCPVFPKPFIEEGVFALLYILASFVKNKVPIGAWIYLGFLSCSIRLCFCFCASTILS